MDAVSATRSFILQSPPGELNDCLTDCRGIFGDDALGKDMPSALQQYNEEQFMVAEVPDHQHKMIICSAGHSNAAPHRYVDPVSRQSFICDHVRLTLSEPEPILVDESQETLREALQQSATQYVTEHLHQGSSVVFAPLRKQPLVTPADAAPGPALESAEQFRFNGVQEKDVIANQAAAELSEAAIQPDIEPSGDSIDLSELPAATLPKNEADEADEANNSVFKEIPSDQDTGLQTPLHVAEPPGHGMPKRFDIILVGNKFNPGNFWTGRWRAAYRVDIETGRLGGEISIDVHYYEQGNVQLSTRKTIERMLPSTETEPAGLSSEVLKIISAVEQEVQVGINEAHVEMNDRTLKDLRRSLPLTKSKLDWNRINSFRTARELSKAG